MDEICVNFVSCVTSEWAFKDFSGWLGDMPQCGCMINLTVSNITPEPLRPRPFAHPQVIGTSSLTAVTSVVWGLHTSSLGWFVVFKYFWDATRWVVKSMAKFRCLLASLSSFLVPKTSSGKGYVPVMHDKHPEKVAPKYGQGCLKIALKIARSFLAPLGAVQGPPVFRFKIGSGVHSGALNAFYGSAKKVVWLISIHFQQTFYLFGSCLNPFEAPNLLRQPWLS